MKTLILDNFDSFTFNLYQFCAELGGNPVVYRNNEITLADIEKNNFTHIMISPGPGTPENKKDFGICGKVIEKFAGKIPILGVCLGHQGIIHAFGGKIIRAPIPMHGKKSEIFIKEDCKLFKNLPKKILGMRYHSLIGEKKTLPRDFIITAETADGIIMAVEHKKFPLYGIQFHPESIGTEYGHDILKNFLNEKCERPSDRKEQRAGSEKSGFESIERPSLIKKQREAQKKGKNKTEKFIDNIAQNKLSEKKIAKMLKIMSEKGESADDILGIVKGLEKYAVKIDTNRKKNSLNNFLDNCGTGGSGLPRMNISTTAAFVLAACGIKMAKHGNRAASGRCGSFDLLEKLGINIELPPKKIEEAIQKIGIGFLFAPLFHPVMKKIAPVRKKLGIRTVFNSIGPLVNPAKPAYHLLGVSSKETAKKLAHVMQKMHYKKALVVSGENGLDDVTLTGKTKIYEVKNRAIKSYEFDPKEVGMEKVPFEKIQGGGAEKNTEAFLALLQNTASEPLKNLLLLNCAFGLFAAEKVKTIQEGIGVARKAIESGKAFRKFLEYKKFSNS